MSRRKSTTSAGNGTVRREPIIIVDKTDPTKSFNLLDLLIQSKPSAPSPVNPDPAKPRLVPLPSNATREQRVNRVFETPLDFAPSGYVYLIYCPGDFYKIGRAKNVRSRFAGIQLGCPYDLVLVHVIPCDDMDRAEIALHYKFTAERHKGEWFKLSQLNIDYVKSLVSFRDGAFITR